MFLHCSFESPCFLLASLICFFLCRPRGLSEFGGELATVSEKESWGPQGEALVVLALAAVVVGLDSQDAVLLLVDAAAGVGDGDDVVELLGDVGGDDDVVSPGLEDFVS